MLKKTMTGRLGLALACGVSLVAMTASPAHAEKFTCPTMTDSFVFGQEAQVAGLDMHFSSAISARNIAMHIYETLMTRDENNAPIHELAESHEVSDDGLTYTFKLRDGITFHNGKKMTSADVLASFERYSRIGIDRGTLESVAEMSAPDDLTFVIKLKHHVPVFIEDFSSFRVPIVIIPAEEAAKEGNQIEYIGTGPFEFVEWIPDSHVELKRFADYQPNEAFDQKTGFGGYKVACFDNLTIRVVKEPGARVAGLETGELLAVEDVPTKAAERLVDNPDIKLLPVDNWWIHIALINWTKPPTDDLKVRRAIQIGLNMEEIMEIATDGAYKLQGGYQYPGNPYYVLDGTEWFNVNDPEQAMALLEEAGYDGEPVVLNTNSDYTNMYNASLVMAEQLKDMGVNAVLEVSDWPTSRDRRNDTTFWNLSFTGFGTGPSIGPRAAVKDLVPPTNLAGAPDDPEMNDAVSRMQLEEGFEGRKQAFADLQQILYEDVYAVPMGEIQKVQATRANVGGFVPFRIPRLWNVWVEE